MIKKADSADIHSWIQLRIQLWPDCSQEECLTDCLNIIESPKSACFICHSDDNEMKQIGFAEISTRDYADGCATSPVGYIEGVFVSKEHRNSGVGRRLIERCHDWFLSKGCTEIGSDTLLHNEAGIRFHKSLGFEEVERHVVFKGNVDADKGPEGTRVPHPPSA